MKVLHVITGLEAGGAELQLAMVVARTRHETDVVSLYNAGSVADRIRAEGGTVRDLGMTSNRQLSALTRLHRLIRRGGYDVVHTHLYRAQIYGRPAARLARTPVVLTTEHSIGETHIERREMSRSVQWLYLASEWFSDGTIAVSDVVKDRLVNWEVPASKITVIPNGVDVEALAYDADARHRTRAQFGIPDDAYVIGSLGRLDPNKRVDLLIEAAAPLLGPRCVLLVVGRGEEQEHLEAVAAAQGVTEHVVFGGFQSDTVGMLSAFDLFAATSRQETFGLSVLEALGNGLPVLYTTCPALDGIVTERARLVEGTVPALREAIREYLEAGVGPREVPHSVFDRYGIDSVVHQIDDYYEQLLERRPRRRQRDVARRASRAEVPFADEAQAAPVG